MENPFDYILKEREEHERQIQLKLQEDELSRLHHKSAHQERLDEKHRYDAIVAEVLEQLQQAAYPSLKVRNHDRGWSIGMWMKRPNGSIDWYSALDVRIEHDWNSRAVYLECTRHHRRIRSEPSREDLVKALQKIFPPIQQMADRGKAQRKK